MILRNLAGILHGEGFAAKQGRHPTRADYWLERGPFDREFAGDRGDTDRVVDASGLIATPAFVDCHTHALFAGSRAHEYCQRWSGASYLDIARSGGGIAATMAAVAAETEESLLAGLTARLTRHAGTGTAVVEVKSGYAATTEGELRLLRVLKRAREAGHCIYRTFMPLHAIPAGRSEAEWVDEMIALLPLVREQDLADGVDAFVDRGFFSKESAIRFFHAAQAHGLDVRAHCDEIANVGATADLIHMGARSVDHLQHIGDDALACWPASNTVATLLPATSFFLGIPYANARRLVDAGAPVALATDFNPGTAPSQSLPFAMLLAAQHLRMTPPEIWCAATHNAARALGWERGASISLWADAGRRDANAFVGDVIVQQLAPRRVLPVARQTGDSRGEERLRRHTTPGRAKTEP